MEALKKSVSGEKELQVRTLHWRNGSTGLVNNHREACLSGCELPKRINNFPVETNPCNPTSGVSQVWSGGFGRGQCVLAQLASSALGWHGSSFVSSLSLPSPLGHSCQRSQKTRFCIMNTLIFFLFLVHREQEGNSNEALEKRNEAKRKWVPTVAKYDHQVDLGFCFSKCAWRTGNAWKYAAFYLDT